MIYLVCSLLLQVRTIKVTNIPLSATAENMKEFFSFSGEIEYVEMRRSVPLLILLIPFASLPPCYLVMHVLFFCVLNLVTGTRRRLR